MTINSQFGHVTAQVTAHVAGHWRPSIKPLSAPGSPLVTVGAASVSVTRQGKKSIPPAAAWPAPSALAGPDSMSQQRW